MSLNLKTLEDNIIEINSRLQGAYIIPVDKDNIRNIRTDIVNLLDDSVDYLKKTYSIMTSWQKEHIVEAINALYRDWLHQALNSIGLAIADPSTVSPQIKYKDEIIHLADDVLVGRIHKVKSYITEINRG